jgi:nicotinate-nucleotide pyrophosphorylase (carboxylating)
LLEASGGIDHSTLRAIAETGVDRISIGSLTKDIKLPITRCVCCK